MSRLLKIYSKKIEIVFLIFSILVVFFGILNLVFYPFLGLSSFQVPVVELTEAVNYQSAPPGQELEFTINWEIKSGSISDLIIEQPIDSNFLEDIKVLDNGIYIKSRNKIYWFLRNPKNSGRVRFKAKIKSSAKKCSFFEVQSKATYYFYYGRRISWNSVDSNIVRIFITSSLSGGWLKTEYGMIYSDNQICGVVLPSDKYNATYYILAKKGIINFKSMRGWIRENFDKIDFATTPLSIAFIENLDKLENKAENLTNLQGTFNLQSKIWQHKGDLVISSPVVLKGVGTIIIDGNLILEREADIFYDYKEEYRSIFELPSVLWIIKGSLIIRKYSPDFNNLDNNKNEFPDVCESNPGSREDLNSNGIPDGWCEWFNILDVLHPTVDKNPDKFITVGPFHLVGIFIVDETFYAGEGIQIPLILDGAMIAKNLNLNRSPFPYEK